MLQAVLVQGLAAVREVQQATQQSCCVAYRVVAALPACWVALAAWAQGLVLGPRVAWLR